MHFLYELECQVNIHIHVSFQYNVKQSGIEFTLYLRLTSQEPFSIVVSAVPHAETDQFFIRLYCVGFRLIQPLQKFDNTVDLVQFKVGIVQFKVGIVQFRVRIETSVE